jgi:hypothetical protein
MYATNLASFSRQGSGILFSQGEFEDEFAVVSRSSAANYAGVRACGCWVVRSKHSEEKKKVKTVQISSIQLLA